MKDLTGQRFGRLKVICDTGERKHNHVVWKCDCDCGKTIQTTTKQLNSGKIHSCGCLRKEVTSRTKSKELTGQRFGKLTVITRVEERRCGGLVWLCKCDCGNTTLSITSNLTSGNSKSCGCSQIEQAKESIGNITDEMKQIPLLHNILDGKLRTNNTSGVTGVYFNKSVGRWCARIYSKGKQTYLGCFHSFEEAVKARKDAEFIHEERIIELEELGCKNGTN